MEQVKIKLYLDYATMLDNRDIIMAFYCRMYYIQELLKSIRRSNETGIDRDSSITLNAVFNKIESTKKALKLEKEEGEKNVKKYYLEMYGRVMASVKDPKADKGLNVKKLGTMIDFI